MNKSPQKQPNAKDGYKGVKDRAPLIKLVDKNGKETIIKR